VVKNHNKIFVFPFVFFFEFFVVKNYAAL